MCSMEHNKGNKEFLMKGVIVCPMIYQNRWTDMYRYLFQKLQGHYNFSIQYTNDCFIPKDTKVVLTFAIPQHDRPSLMVDYLSKVPKNVFMIGYMRDLQDYGNQEVVDSMRKMFDRYDIILSSAKSYFLELYPEYEEKMVVFPDFFGPENRYTGLNIKENPINMCLLSGAFNPKVYPIRDFIRNNGDGNKIVHIPPPYFNEHKFIGDAYAKLLNRFECCVTESGIYPYVVTKCFEIPAAGSLLLTNKVSDMDDFGFIPNIHYVPINKENVLETINSVLEYPTRYKMIKEAGRKFVHCKHSIENRFLQLKTLIEERVR